MIRCWFVLAFVAVASPSPGHTGDCLSQLQVALTKRLPRPDLVLNALESSNAELRQQAAQGIGRWSDHVPGAMECLRRLAHDEDSSVAVAAIESASQIGSRQSFVAIADSLSRDFNADQVARVADAMDTRAFRLYWKRSDEFALRGRIVDLIGRRSQSHRADELARLVFPTATRSIIESGRSVFQSAGCVGCHRVNGYGRDAFPLSLRGVGQCYDNATLVQHILTPSLDIHDAGRQERFVTSSGRVLVGRLVQTKGDRIAIQTNASQPGQVEWIGADELEERGKSEVSPMPTGLLDANTPTQIADLVVFLRTDGGLVTLPSGSHDHH